MSRVWILCFLVLSCGTEPDSPPPPAAAHVMKDGVRWVLVKPGTGRLGAQAVWWSVDWSDIPCSEVECKHVYNGRRSTEVYDPFRGNLLEMREGEMRRLWIPRKDRKGFWTADVQLYEVFDTGPDGGPAYQH